MSSLDNGHSNNLDNFERLVASIDALLATVYPAIEMAMDDVEDVTIWRALGQARAIIDQFDTEWGTARVEAVVEVDDE